MSKGAKLALAGVTALALAVRVWGNHWGAPARVDLHPDEIDYVMHHAFGLIHRMGDAFDHPGHFSQHTLDPVFLNYPGFLMYLIALVAGALRRMDVISETWQTYLVGRNIVALFGAATAPVVYALARGLNATRPGALLAALWMALLPLHVWESHTAVTDIPMVFFTTLTLVAALRLLHAGRWRDYAFAGASLGLAVGSKYTAAIVVVSVVVAAFASPRPKVHTIKGLALAAAVSLVCCFAVTPYSFIRFKDLLAAMSFEHHHTLSQHFGFCVYAVGWWFRRWIYQLLAAWPFSLGFALYASCAAGALWAVLKFDRKILVVMSFASIYYYVTGSWTFTPLRYYLPILVIGVALAGRWMGDWLASPTRACRVVAATAAVLTAAYTGFFTFQTTARYSDDTRMQAGRWIQETQRPGAVVMSYGWRRYIGVPDDGERFILRFATEQLVRQIKPDAPYDLMQITSLAYMRHYRHGNMRYVDAYERLRDPDGPFELVKKFESHFINKKLYMKLDPMFEGYFISPTIEFYRSKSFKPPAA